MPKQKRSAPSCSPSPDPLAKPEPSRTPSPEAKPKAKRAKANVAGGSAGGKTMWDASRSAALLEEVFEAAKTTVCTDAVATKLGVTRSQIVDQLKVNRSNIRSMAIELVRAKKGGA